MEALLSFSAPLDVALLDKIVNVLSVGTPAEIKQAQEVLTKFQEHPDAWQRVDSILQTSSNLHSKYFALQVLEIAINTRWKILPQEQRLGIREFIVNLLIKLSRDEGTLRAQKVLIHKLNHTLVQILKQDWPQNWPNFISDLVGASKTSEALCENNMNILRLLSEEIFDFSLGQMTEAKISQLKSTLNSEFTLVFEMCQAVLLTSTNANLLVETLQTLLKFLNWIPLGYIFETKMIEMLVGRFLPVPLFRNHALRCLTEIGALDTGNKYEELFIALFHGLMVQIATILPLPPEDETHVHYAGYLQKLYNDGSEDDGNFIANLGLFFASFFRVHLPLMEGHPSTASSVITAHKYLIAISNVDHKEIFKTCLEYWLWLAEDVYKSWRGTSQQFVWGPLPVNSHRKVAYSSIFSDCRKTMIRKMVKPEEVIIVEDENGEITKEYMPDVDAQQLYHTMRELLIFLTHLDYEDTETIMLDKLCAQVDRSEWSWHNLNTLCWAIGSISGAMSEDDEKRFLVAVIKDLLGLCEMIRGKENKAVVASNIMYVVGQYPRFLKAHWKFLKTVVNKLFEFMHETFPGVQDMAVDTFLKICKQCKEKFVVIQAMESQTFVEEILTDIGRTIVDLDAPQKQIFYEAIGHMISASKSPERETLIMKLMELPNGVWSVIINKAQQNIDNLRDVNIMKELANVIKTNVRVCRAVGHPYIVQLSNLFNHMMTLYKLYSSLITGEVSNRGVQITRHSHVRSMRIIKREILRLVQEFIEHCEDADYVTNAFVPPLLEAILLDYKNSVADARDAQVLSLMAVIVNKLQSKLVPEVGRILEATLEPTLQMITKNFEDFPEHRINFFKLLKELNAFCFPTFLAAVQQSKVIMDSIVWAFKHAERNIAETGLTILFDFLRNVLVSDVATPFYQAFYLSLLNDVFAVLTDSLHKTGFKMQCQVLQHMVQVVSSGRITAPLSPQQAAGVDNVTFAQQYLLTLLSNFQNLTRRQIEIFIKGMFELKDDLHLFKTHMRDFLVQLKEFSAQDNTDLYDEEREAELAKKKEALAMRLQAVPGLQAPAPPNARDQDQEEMLD